MKQKTLYGILWTASALALAACGGGGGGGSTPTPTPSPTATPPPAEPDFVSCVGTTCTITGDVDQDYTLVSSRNWIIDGVVRVGAGNVNLADAAAVQAVKAAGVTLTIQPGVSVKAMAR